MSESMPTENKIVRTPAKHLVLLTLLLTVHIIVNIVWLSLDLTPPSWDPSVHLQNSVVLYRGIFDPQFSFSRWITLSSYYPPLLYIATFPFYMFRGISEDHAVLVNLLFLTILILSTYKLGRRLFDSRTGLLASAIVSFYPIVFGLSRQYYIDFALTCLIPASLACLDSAFRRNKHILLCGLLLGMGMLVKWTFILFFIGPFILEILGRIRSSPGRVIMTSLTVLAIGVLIASIWYLPNAENLIRSAGVTGFDLPSAKGRPELLSPESLRYYLTVVINQYMFLPSFFLFLLGWTSACVRRPSRLLLSAFWLIVPYAAFTLIHEKEVRYLMPVLPILACFSASFITSFRKGGIRKPLSNALMVFMLAQFLFISFGIGPFPALHQIYSPWGAWVVWSNETLSTGACSDADWKIPSILEDARKHGASSSDQIAFLPNLPLYNQNILHFYRVLQNNPVGIRGYIFPYFDLDDPSEVLDQSFILIKTGYQGSPETLTHTYRIMSFLALNQELVAEMFNSIARYDLPDGSKAELLQRKPDVTSLPCAADELPLCVEAGIESIHLYPDRPMPGSVLAAFIRSLPGRRVDPAWSDLVLEDESGRIVLRSALNDASVQRGAESAAERCISIRTLLRLPADLKPGQYSIGIWMNQEGIKLACPQVTTDVTMIETQSVIHADAPNDGAVLSRFPQRFAWRASPPDPFGYRFEIRGGVFLTPYSEKVFGTEYPVPADDTRLDAFPKGRYEWRITPLKRDGSDGPASAVFSFDLQ